MKLSSKTTMIVLGLTLCVCILGYWCAPIHFSESDPKIESLIEQLASTNSPPEFAGDPPHFFFEEFLENPGNWDLNAQVPVCEAYIELKSMGKTAFPYLIKHLDDKRYSHERCSSTFISRTVGDACQSLIDEQIEIVGMTYKSRKTPTGFSVGDAVLFEAYVESNYGSYAAWWRDNKNTPLVSMRVDFCKWRIKKEKQLGFVDDDQRNRITKNLNRILEDAKSPPDEMANRWYVDELYKEVRVFREYENAKQR